MSYNPIGRNLSGNCLKLPWKTYDRFWDSLGVIGLSLLSRREPNGEVCTRGDSGTDEPRSA